MLNQRRYRPMGVSDLFDEAFDLYKSNFGLFLSATAIVFVPLHILMFLLVYPRLAGVQNGAGAAPGLQQYMDLFGAGFTTLMIGWGIYFLVFMVLGGALTSLVSQRYLDRPARIAQGYGVAMRRSALLLIASIPVALGVIIGSVLIVPGLLVEARMVCLPQVMFLEPKLTIWGALLRTWRLTRGYAWRNIGVLFMLTCVMSAINTALQTPIYMLLSLVPVDSLPFLPAIAEHRNVADEIASAIASLLVAPFGFALLTVVYYDLRIREEGFDMEILSEQLGHGTVESKWQAPPRRALFRRRASGTAAQ